MPGVADRDAGPGGVDAVPADSGHEVGEVVDRGVLRKDLRLAFEEPADVDGE